MGMLDDLRVNIGDDDGLALPSGSGIPAPVVIDVMGPSILKLLRDVRVNSGDDDGVDFPSGIASGNLPTVDVLGVDILAMLRDVKVDIGEDAALPSGAISGVLPSVTVLGPNLSLLLRDARVNVGDDDGVNFGEINVIPPEPECPEVWCTTIVNSTPYDTTAQDVIIFVNSPVVTTINLAHTPILGQLIIIKDLSGNAFSNNIIVNPAPYQIDGLDLFKISQNKQSIMITWSGTEWNIV